MSKVRDASLLLVPSVVFWEVTKPPPHKPQWMLPSLPDILMNCSPDRAQAHLHQAQPG